MYILLCALCTYLSLGSSSLLSLNCIWPHYVAEDSSTPPPVPPMTPVVVSSIHTPTPTAVIHPQTIAQVPTDDPSSSEPPPLPPKSSFWKTAATPSLPSPDRSIKQPRDTKQAVPVGPKVYYNIVPEVGLGVVLSACSYIVGWGEVDRTVQCFYQLRRIYESNRPRYILFMNFSNCTIPQ